MAWECVCVDAAQVRDVWACPVEAAKCVWVMARLDVDRDHACVVRTEADEVHSVVDTARSAEDEARSVANAAENPADIMGAEIAIDPCEYSKNNSNPAGSALKVGLAFFWRRRDGGQSVFRVWL